MTGPEGEQERAVELIGRLAPASAAEPGNVHSSPTAIPRTGLFLMYEQYAFKAPVATQLGRRR
jgi:quinol monooxygenase YgiN